MQNELREGSNEEEEDEEIQCTTTTGNGLQIHITSDSVDLDEPRSSNVWENSCDDVCLMAKGCEKNLTKQTNTYTTNMKGNGQPQDHQNQKIIQKNKSQKPKPRGRVRFFDVKARARSSFNATYIYYDYSIY